MWKTEMRKIAAMFASACFLMCLAVQQSLAVTNETILVTAERFPSLATGEAGSIDIISRDDIRDSAQDEIAALLEEKLDIVILRRGIASASGIALRGVSGGGMNNKLRLYVDGMPVNTLRKGFSLESIDIHTVERIELLRGPSSALYGGGALVGVINIVTSPIEKTIAVGAGAGSYGTRKSNFVFGDTKGRFAYRLNASFLGTDGHIRNLGGTDLCNPAQIINSGMTLDYKLDSSLLSFSARDFRTERDEAEFSIGGPTPGAYAGRTEDIKQRTGFYSLNYSRSFEQSRMSLKLFDIVDEEKSSLVPREKAENMGASFQFESKLSDRGLIFSGADIEKHSLHSDASGLTFKRDYAAPFLHLIVDVLPEKLLFSAGARYDMPDKFDNQLSPKVGLIYKASGRLRFRGGLNYGFRYPTVTDLYSTVSPLGDASLDCEKSKNIEAGIDYSAGDFELSGSVFKMTVKDMIISRVISPGPPRVKQYFNVDGDSPYKGFELKSSRAFTPHIKLGAAYSYLDPGDLTFHTDKHRLKGSLALNAGGHSLEMNASYAKDRYLWDYESGARDDYALYDLTYTMRFRRTMKFYVNVINIGDEEYFVNFYDPQPGRHFMTGVEYAF